MPAEPDSKAYAPIPSLIPSDLGDESVNKSNEAFKKAVAAQIGVHQGFKNTTLGQFEVRNVNGNQILMRKDPNDPTRVQIWQTNADSPSSVPLGGEQFGGMINTLRNQVSQSGQNPLTGKTWAEEGRDVMDMNYGQLRRAQQMQERGSGYHAPAQSDLDDLTNQSMLRDTLKDIETQYKLAGGKEGMDKTSQFMQGLKTQDISNMLNGKTTVDDPKRAAYLKLMRDFNVLNANGANVTRFAQESSGGTSTTGILDALHPVMNFFSAGLTKGVQNFANGEFDPDAVRANVPMLRAMMNRSLYSKVANMADPSQKLRLTDSYRKLGNDAANDLTNNQKIGPNDSVTDAPMIEEPGEEKATTTTTQQQTPAQAQTTNQQPAQQPTDGQPLKVAPLQAPATAQISPPPWHPQKSEVTKAVDQAGQNIVSGTKELVNPQVRPHSIAGDRAGMFSDIEALGRTAKSAVENTLPWGKAMFGDQPQSDIEKSKPLFPKSPRPAAPSSADAQPQPAPLKVEPFEKQEIVPQAQNTTGADNAPRLTQQEHVDALEPGTPFYWADHDQPYVKV